MKTVSRSALVACWCGHIFMYLLHLCECVVTVQ